MCNEEETSVFAVVLCWLIIYCFSLLTRRGTDPIWDVLGMAQARPKTSRAGAAEVIENP